MAIFLAVVAVATAFALVMSISSLAMPAGSDANTIENFQDLTPMPTETALSQAGSTDGIMWMGAAIAAIVLLPLVANRVMWQKQQ